MLEQVTFSRFLWQRSFTDMGQLLGDVTAFDQASGLGVITSGEDHFPFHATSIASGLRTIAVGAQVAFAPLHGSGGRIEAGHITLH